jgi:hypothetical protein
MAHENHKNLALFHELQNLNTLKKLSILKKSIYIC